MIGESSMTSEQIAIMPMQLGAKLIASSVQGVAPMLIGATGLAIVGTIYASVKATQAISNNIKKPKAGLNKKASKIVNNGAIKSLSVDNSIYDEFARQATKLGIKFAACNGTQTTNIIVNEDQKDAALQILKTVKKDLEKVASNHVDHIKEESFENSDISGLIKEATDKSIDKLEPYLLAVKEKDNSTIVTLTDNPEKLKEIIPKLEILEAEFSDLANPSVILPLTTYQNREIHEMFKAMLRQRVEKITSDPKNASITWSSERLEQVMSTELSELNQKLLNIGVQIKGAIVNGQLKVNIRENDFSKFLRYAARTINIEHITKSAKKLGLA